MIRSKASRTSVAEVRFSLTPPMSVLCRMSGEAIFITTGYPIDFGGSHRFICVCGEYGFRQRDAICRQDIFGFGITSGGTPSLRIRSSTCCTLSRSTG